MNHGAASAIFQFINYSIMLNMILFLFNLIPLPPLDGYRVLQDLLPVDMKVKLQKVEQWAIYIFLLLLFIPQLSNFFLGPLFALSRPIISLFSDILRLVFKDFGY